MVSRLVKAENGASGSSLMIMGGAGGMKVVNRVQ